MSGDQDALRASDFDRDFVVDQLREALGDGRLTLPEFDDRVRAAYAAKTLGELRKPLADLSDGAVLPIDGDSTEAIHAVEAQRGAMFGVVILLAALVAVVLLVDQLGSVLPF
jgi:hypothetical protein